MSEEVQSTSTPRRRIRRSNGEASPVLDGSADTSPIRRRKGEVDRTSAGLQRRFVDVLGWTVLAIWSIGFGVDMLDLKKGWDLPAGIWGLMTLVCGAAFVGGALKKETQE